MEIPRGSSHPTDVDAPSFLTKLPPEIRNLIYRLLFCPLGTVLLHNQIAYHVRLPGREEHRRGREYDAAIERYDEIYDSEVRADDEFNHGLHLSIPLLLTCRQIYHESIGLLYGRNTFVISRALTRHEFDVEELHEPSAYDQNNYAPIWLFHLGSNISLLTKVCIDVDAICPRNCNKRITRSHMSLLPLITLCWRYPRLIDKIEFVHTGRVLLVHTTYEIMETGPITFASRLNNILHALVKKDALDLRRLAPFPRLLGSICIRPDNNSGRIGYGYEGYEEHEDMIHRDYDDVGFSISEDGTSLRYVKDPTDPQLGRFIPPRKLPPSILSCITRNVVGPASRITFDMDTCGVQSLSKDLILLWAFFWSRSDVYSIVLETHDIVLQAATNDTTTDFDGFPSLSYLESRATRAQHPHDHFLDELRLGPRSPKTSLALNLTINSSTNTELRDIRIDIRGLLNLLVLTRGFKTRQIHLTLKCPSYTRLGTIPFSTLEKPLFLLLSHIMLELPNHPDSTTYHTRFPQIWITGLGTILHAKYPSFSVVGGEDDELVVDMPVRYATHRPEQIMAMGYRMTRHRIAFIEYDRGRMASGSIYNLWCALKTKYWHDHYKFRP